MPKLSEFLFGKREQPIQQQSTLTSGQSALLEQLTGGLQQPQMEGLNLLQMLLSGDSELTEQFEKPLMEMFEQQIIPGIAERFGGLGAQESSGFGQTLGGAGAGLAAQLGAMRGQLRTGALSQLQGLLGMGMGRQGFENILRPQQPGLFHGLAGGVGQGLGSGLGSTIGGLF